VACAEPSWPRGQGWRPYQPWLSTCADPGLRGCIDLLTGAAGPELESAAVSRDARAVALAILALAEAVADASRRVAETVVHAANSLDTAIHTASTQIGQ
jgi:hypothetical protein